MFLAPPPLRGTSHVMPDATPLRSHHRPLRAWLPSPFTAASTYQPQDVFQCVHACWGEGTASLPASGDQDFHSFSCNGGLHGPRDKTRSSAPTTVLSLCDCSRDLVWG